jgi:peptidyl-prolyl cis-trans isomerase C
MNRKTMTRRASVLAACIALASPSMSTAQQGAAPAQTAPAAQGGGPSPAAEGAVANVNGVALSRAELERRLRQQEALGRVRDTPEVRERIRNEMIAEELLFQEAVRLNVDQSPAFKQAMETARRSALATVMLQSARPAPVSDEQVRTAYDNSVKGLEPNDLRLRAIVVDNQAKIREIRSALAKGAEFADLARKNSRLPSAPTGGDLGWVNLRAPAEADNGPLPAEISAEVRKLQKGGFTAPAADKRGLWWILKLEDTRPSQPAPFDQVKGNLRAILESNARTLAAQQLLVQLRSKAAVKLEP